MGVKEKERRKKRLASAKKGNEALGGFWPGYLKRVEGMDMFRFTTVRDYEIDIIPFEAGSGNPGADEGELYYVRTFYIHKDIGPDEKSRLCLQTFGKPCPICKKVQQMVSEGQLTQDSDAHKALKSKMRQMYLFYDRDEPNKGVRLYECGVFKSFGIKLKNLQDTDKDDDKGYQTFHDPEGGYTLTIMTDSDTFQGKEFVQPVKLKFTKRPEGIPQELLDKAVCLDDLLIEMDADQLLALFTGEEMDAPEDKKAPAKAEKPAKKEAAPAAPKTPPPKDGEGTETAQDKGIKKGSKVIHKKLGECEVMKVSPDGTSLMLQDEDGELHEAIAPSRVELVEDEDEEEEAPKKAPAAKAGKKPAPKEDEDEDEEEEDEEEDEDEEEEDEEEEDEPAPKKKGGKKPAPKEDDDDDDWEDD